MVDPRASKVKLSISYSQEDRETALRIGSMCDELRIDHVLDERNDWLMHALRQRPEGSTHLLVIVSPANEKSWWLPFQLGRATEHGITIVPYQARLTQGLPSFLRDSSRVVGLESLGGHVRSLQELHSTKRAAAADTSGENE